MWVWVVGGSAGVGRRLEGRPHQRIRHYSAGPARERKKEKGREREGEKRERCGLHETKRRDLEVSVETDDISQK